MLLGRRVTFVGGKGGVGKTTIAAALAVTGADEGKRTLLVSTDAAHSTGDVLEADLGPEIRRVADRLDAIELDPSREADAYISDVKDRLAEAVPPRLAAEVERQIDAARVAPGAEEAALFERFARLLEASPDYDRVVFDTAPTGQTLRLMSLPELMTVWMGGLIRRRRQVGTVGRMWRRVAGAEAGSADPGAADPVLEALERRRDLFVGARAVMTDASRAGFLFVVTPERLPVRETARALDALGRHGIPVLGLVVNQVVPEGAEDPFFAGLRARQAGLLEEIDREFADLRRWRVPLRGTDVVGLAALREVGRELSVGPSNRRTGLQLGGPR